MSSTSPKLAVFAQFAAITEETPRTGTRKPDKLRLRREAAALLGAAT